MPAIVAGFIASVPCLMIFSELLMMTLRIDVRSIPSDGAIIQALIVGFIIPMLSAGVPISAALAKNLNDALDLQRSKSQAVYMQVLESGGRNIRSLLTFGIFASSYGLGVYYLLPYSLLSFNLYLVVRIFVFILFGMMFALTLIAINSQRMLEIAFT